VAGDGIAPLRTQFTRPGHGDPARRGNNAVAGSPSSPEFPGNCGARFLEKRALLFSRCERIEQSERPRATRSSRRPAASRRAPRRGLRLPTTLNLARTKHRPGRGTAESLDQVNCGGQLRLGDGVK
jgi:hypothetical protein